MPLMICKNNTWIVVDNNMKLAQLTPISLTKPDRDCSPVLCAGNAYVFSGNHQLLLFLAVSSTYGRFLRRT